VATYFIIKVGDEEAGCGA